MTITEMIAVWRQGCSIAMKVENGKVTFPHPEDCPHCTRGLIEAIEKRIAGNPELAALDDTLEGK